MFVRMGSLRSTGTRLPAASLLLLIKRASAILPALRVFAPCTLTRHPAPPWTFSFATGEAKTVGVDGVRLIVHIDSIADGVRLHEDGSALSSGDPSAGCL